MDYWIALTSDLKSKEYLQPKQDSEVFIWIHKHFDRNWDANTPMYKYEIFSADLQPLELSQGNFTIKIMEDHCRSIGCGTHYSLKFGIIDKKNELRIGYGFGQQENGIIETIKLLRKVANYEDWDDYYKNTSK